MNVLLLSRYSFLGASSRYRFYQFVPHLEKKGISITAISLLNDEYIITLYKKRKMNWINIFYAYGKRFFFLFKNARRYELLWIEKELFPGLPAWVEKGLAYFNIPYIVDYDDAIFHNYDMNPKLLVRLLLRNKIDTVMRNANLVIAGNDYLMERAVYAGAERIEKLPTVIDLQRYSLAPPPNNECFIIGWIGSPSTARYLQLIRPALAAVCANRRARVVLVGSGEIELADVPVEIRKWSEDTEVSNLKSFDVGIMPLQDSQWENGKCGFKLIQYMGCGRPVVGSSVGVNKKIIQQGVNGFQATTNEEWIEALETLCDNVDLRNNMGRAGRTMVEQEYCLQVVAPKLVNLMLSFTRSR